MPALDFTEIAVPTAGSGRDVFELFARDVLDLLGFKVLEGPDIVSIWHPYDDTCINSDRTEHIYFACKGVCDDRLRAPLRAEKMIDGWEDIPDLAIPTVYLRWVMSLLNELRGGKTYSDQAFDKMKDLLLNLFPLVFRHPSDEDTERVRALQQIPRFLGGFGG